MLTKKEIRKEVLAERRALDEETVALSSQVICNKILKSEFYAEAENICLYMPIRNEVDVLLLAEAAYEDGKQVWIPKVVGDEMVFNAYEHGQNLVTGAYDITESASETVLDPEDNTLIIMPGAVFTADRNRIGYGGGFYDKYLAKHPNCRTMAVCYDLQIVMELPVEEHDRKPDVLISESHVYM